MRYSQKEFPVDLEGQTIEFKCPICSSVGDTHLPYKSSEERENLDLELDQVEMNRKIAKNLKKLLRTNLYILRGSIKKIHYNIFTMLILQLTLMGGLFLFSSI